VQEKTPPVPGTVPADPARWVVVPTPAPDSEAWRVAQFSDITWQVWGTTEGVRVRLLRTGPAGADAAPEAFPVPFTVNPGKIADPPGVAPGKSSLSPAGNGAVAGVAVPGGYLYARNYGEWGGSVYWISRDGKTLRKISEDQVVRFFATPDGIFAAEGLAHLGIRRGTLVRFQQPDAEKAGASAPWISKPVVDLSDAPRAGLILPDGDFLIATSAKLLGVTRIGRITLLVPAASWAFFYPESIARASNGDVYLGMRYAVARVRADSGLSRVEWLVPNREYAGWKHHRSRLL
jgi:hypothetical protein